MVKIFKQRTRLLKHPLFGFPPAFLFILFFKLFPFRQHIFYIHLAGDLLLHSFVFRQRQADLTVIFLGQKMLHFLRLSHGFGKAALPGLLSSGAGNRHLRLSRFNLPRGLCVPVCGCPHHFGDLFLAADIIPSVRILFHPAFLRILRLHHVHSRFRPHLHGCCRSGAFCRFRLPKNGLFLCSGVLRFQHFLHALRQRRLKINSVVFSHIHGFYLDIQFFFLLLLFFGRFRLLLFLLFLLYRGGFLWLLPVAEQPVISLLLCR